MSYQPHSDRDVAEPNIVLRGVVGSTSLGLALSGTDDLDEMAVCCEPPEYVIGNRRFEQWIYRSAEERAGHTRQWDQRKHGRTPKSEPGDLDLVCYSLRKWCSLAAQGNPSIINLLFLPTYSVKQYVGVRLLEKAEMFASRQAGHRFLGYLVAQKQRLLGERGQMRVTRTELISEYGYDTKFAMHAVRLGIQGIEYLETGRLTLPLDETNQKVCMMVRKGAFSLASVVGMIEWREEMLKELLEKSPLPEKPDYDAINEFLIDSYKHQWNSMELADRLVRD